MNKLRITGGHDNDFISKKQIQLMNSMNPAQRQLSFQEFKDVQPSARIAFLDTLLHDANIQYTSIEHIYSGPKSNRKLTGISLVEFSSNQTAQNALSKLGGPKSEFQISDSVKLTVKSATSKINLKRNWSLCKAYELIKNSILSNIKEVKIEFKNRKILIEGRDAFS